MNFVSLHNHSVFSFHAGVCTVEELAARAKSLGMSAIALTDTDRMSGLIRFHTACLKVGIKPILGVELTDPQNEREKIVLLARNLTGYGDLCEIISERHLSVGSFSFRAIFAKPWPNLFFIATTPDTLTLLAATPNRERLYGELVNNSPLTREQSRAVAEAAQRLDVPLVVSNNPFFLDQSDWEVHRLLSAIGRNSTISRLLPHEYASEWAFLRPMSDMARLFPNHAGALENSAKIADQCSVDFGEHHWIMPAIEVAGESPAENLRRLALAGLERNYGGTPAYDEAARIQEMELGVIEKLGYTSYFLIVKDVCDWAGKHFAAGYRTARDCTILRGSAANAITFFNLGVSSLDPVRYDLYFQRFLNEDRASPPDADLDFGWDEREEALDYLVNRWGRDRVAITCTTNHFRRRAAFRETAKVFGYSEEQISEIMKRMKRKRGQRPEERGQKSKEVESEQMASLDNSRKNPYSAAHSSALPGLEAEDEEIKHIYMLAEKIRGKPRFLGQHPGGVLITNSPIRRHVACEFSGGTKNRIITQIDMHNGIDELGLIKFDILGNGSLSVLRDTLAQLQKQAVPDPHVSDLEKCYADPAVQTMIKRGRTRGIFYIESPAQMRLNLKAQAETFEEIAITSSLVRPAGAAYTKTFVERHRKMKLGIKDWEYLHPSLEPILAETHDVCAYQEDVTKICHQVAGLSYKKADRIRKMMNSLHDGMLSDEEFLQTAGEFINGCMRHSGLSRPQAVELWERVSSFTGFSFCKSHSASYAQLSFKCAYLKAHYPALFLSSVVSNNHGFYSRDVYLDEARRWGIRVLPVSINQSAIPYTGRHRWLRVGFMHIRNLTRRSMDEITSARHSAPYRNLPDFVSRAHVGKKETESLILVGAFDGFGLTQPESLYLLDDLYRSGSNPAEPSLFSESQLLTPERLHPGLSDYSFTQKCLNELHLLGFMVSGNILDILDLHPASRNTAPAAEIGRFMGKRIKIFGWPITNRVAATKEDKPMLFVTLEDKTGCVDVILWPDVYERYADLLADPGPFEVWGRVTEDWGALTLEADSIKAVQWSPAIVDFEKASQRLRNSFKAADYVYTDVAAEVTAAA